MFPNGNIVDFGLSINCHIIVYITNNGYQLINAVANLKISKVPEMVTKNALIDSLLSFSRIINFIHFLAFYITYIKGTIYVYT